MNKVDLITEDEDEEILGQKFINFPQDEDTSY